MASDEFLARLKAEASRLGSDPAVFLPTLYFESKGLNPAAVSPDGKHFGLNQLSAGWLRSHGIDPADYVRWTDAAQVPEVMRFVRYLMHNFTAGEPFADPVRFYIANFLPGRLSRATSDDAVLTQEGEIFYERNKGLDVDKTGTITVGDIRRKMAQTEGLSGYQLVLVRLRKITVVGPGGGGDLLVALGFGALALWGAHTGRSRSSSR